MKKVKVLLIFYKRIVLPALFFAVFFSLIGVGIMETIKGYFIGICWIVLLPVLHFINYEIRTPKTYYFYYNLGWSKLQLWVGTLILMSTLTLLLFCL